MTRKPLALALLLTLGGGGAALLTGAPAAVERAMFGNTFSRNMVSDEKGLPADWDVKTGRNVKWWADVGSQAYAGPWSRAARSSSARTTTAFATRRCPTTAAWSWRSPRRRASSSGR